MPRRALIELALILLAVLAALALRQFVAAPFAVPSESMQPTLLAGDIILADRWRWQVRRQLPARGDVIVFRVGGRTFVKRLIGLPGDRIAMAGGRLLIDGRPLPRWRVADLLLPATACPDAERQPDGGRACRIPRIREMLPGGRTVDALQAGGTARDTLAELRVPAGRLFVLGDNRDRSADSRLDVDAGGVGLVPVAALVGTARAIIVSTDGSARWRAPRGWLRAVRWDRVGLRF